MRILLILLVIILTGYASHRIRRVVDGRKASRRQFPYLVSIQTTTSQNKRNHVCGGAIIHKRYILTAAHCIIGEIVSNLSVLVGTTSLSKGGKIYYVENIRMHHKYVSYEESSKPISSNDIAILRLHKNILFDKETQPIPIASHTSRKIPLGANLTIGGWGSINKHLNIYTDFIQYFEGTLISHKQCNTLFTYLIMQGDLELTMNDICTMAPVNRGICDGDSGGPVVYNGTLVGIVSRAAQVCGVGIPDIHTKVSRYEKWIGKTLAQMNKNPTKIIKSHKKILFF